MRTLLTIDPGKHLCGVAWFHDKTLVKAALVKTPDLLLEAPEYPHIDELWIESQQVYSQWKANPSDLIDLAHIAGEIKGRTKSTAFNWVLPAKWKGQVKKEIMTARIISKLSIEEQRTIAPCAKSLLHNVIDAVGIGLYVNGRL